MEPGHVIVCLFLITPRDLTFENCSSKIHTRTGPVGTLEIYIAEMTSQQQARLQALFILLELCG